MLTLKLQTTYAPYLRPIPYTVSMQFGQEYYQETVEVGPDDELEPLLKAATRKILENANII